MKNMSVRNWIEYVDIDTTGRYMEKELSPWLDENGCLILVEDGEDYRDEFVRQWSGLMNEEFGEKYL